MAGRIEGKVAVVTGGCSGIGLATVKRFAAEGAKVVIGDVDDANGSRIAQELGGAFVHCDVTNPEQVETLFRTAKEKFGSVDIAFNNAGISPPEDDSILTTDLDAWRKVQEVNLTSVYLCCKAALPYMLEQKRGSIINTASFVAVVGAATSQISYTASKGGVLSMSRELGVQFAREGVRVNALCPGPVNTPLLQQLFATDPERTSLSGGSPSPTRWPMPCCSWPATSPASSPRRSSWSMAGSPAPTSPPSDRRIAKSHGRQEFSPDRRHHLLCRGSRARGVGEHASRPAALQLRGQGRASRRDRCPDPAAR